MKCVYILPAVVAVAGMTGTAVAESNENLLEVAATATDMSELEKEMSSLWASVFYQVNQDLNMAKYTDESGAYSSAVWLYGTTQLPAAFNPSWVSGYVSRAREVYAETASADIETPTHDETSTNGETSTGKEESTTLPEDSSTDSPSTETSSATPKPRTHVLSAASFVVASAIVAVAAFGM
ncbi:hypothetical protein H4217_008975 [Coemansia sp. RSA 1939]|nr:hypothetical protein H4217_008975 [Coemansia sp. RSA 1939]KAJ2600721.1 hypothetical protein EV177_007095 [Coemansia sp. RSA 1804]KAJ2657184.1 hypothetical protein GGH99_007080 [Coemansia sp. RSA 1285]